MASIRVGDQVNVPGEMYGVVKFVGSVAGKNGTFAGVQLASEFAQRGKNSGDVEGRYYFRTTLPGSGIFLPVEKATKRSNTGPILNTPAARASPIPGAGPGTPNRLGTFNQGGRTPTLAKPSFSQSVGPGAMRAGAASPALKPPVRRESLPRPQSPLRKVNTPTSKGLATPKARPSIGLGKSTLGAPTPSGRMSTTTRPVPKFSQSLRQPATTPGKLNLSPLGPESSFDEVPEEEVDSSPTPTPISERIDTKEIDRYKEEARRLKQMLMDKDRALQEQTSSIAEMERSLMELQTMMPELERRSRSPDDEDLPRDVVTLRAALKDKNDKIKMLTAEFDANRADFRSTIDTLEMASTETERVYEKRVDELLEEIRSLQERGEDVENVALQLKQLEDLVQELEEGLEDARRGEAEARGEVEFLRGEVERSRSELRRERERKRTEEQLNGYGANDAGQDRAQELQTKIDSKDDEIRGLKAIINSLNKSVDSPDLNGSERGNSRIESGLSDETHLNLQKQIYDLERLLEQKSAHEEELESEVTKLRQSVQLGKFPMPGSAFGIRTGNASNNSHSRTNSSNTRDKHISTGTVGSQRTVVLSPENEGAEWGDPSDSPNRDQSPERHDRSHPRESSTDPSTLWCEICEESGHDILTCSNMFSRNQQQSKTTSKLNNSTSKASLGKKPGSGMLQADRPAPLTSRKASNAGTTIKPNGTALPQPPDSSLPAPPTPTATTFNHKDTTHDTSPIDTHDRTPRGRDSTSNHDRDLNRDTDHDTSRDSSTTNNDRYVDAEETSPVIPHHYPQPNSNSNTASKSAVKSPIIEGTGDQAGMFAGRNSGVIDPEKWCALCERDGHESVDCPVEESF